MLSRLLSENMKFVESLIYYLYDMKTETELNIFHLSIFKVSASLYIYGDRENVYMVISDPQYTEHSNLTNARWA